MKYKMIPVINMRDLREAIPKDMMKRINYCYESQYVVPFYGLLYDLSTELSDTLFKIRMDYDYLWLDEPRLSLHKDFMEFLHKTIPEAEYIIIEDVDKDFII